MKNYHLPEELVSDIIMYSISTYAYLWELKYNFYFSDIIPKNNTTNRAIKTK